MPRVLTLRARRIAAGLAAIAVAGAGVILPASPAFAAVVGIDKATIGVPDDGVQPGGSFTYVLRADCTSLAEDCQNVTVTDTFPPEFVPDIVPGTYTWTGGPDTDPPGGTIFAGVSQYTYTYDGTSQAISFTVPSIPAGTSASVQVGVTLPADTTVPDGTVVPNTATVSADNAPSASDSVDVLVNVPVEVGVQATKDWADGSALAGSGEVSTVTLGVTNTSTGAAGVTSLTLTDQTNSDPPTDPWNYFDLTGFGAVTYPDGADQVQIQYCTLPYAQACGAWTLGAVQTGSPVQPDPGVDLAQVTGVRFVFSSSTGAPIPNGASGNVAFTWQLRDTERVDGTTPIEPVQTQTITNAVTPSAANASGSTDGDPATDTFQIVPNIASVDLTKSWFADSDGDYQPDNPPSAPAQRRWPVSGVIDVTNTSPFPVETVTVREPSATDPQSGLTVLDLTQIRLRFPDGAATAQVTITCADNSQVVRDVPNPPALAVLDRPADFTCPAAGPDDPSMKVTSIEVVYASPPGTAAIAPGSAGGLDFSGTLDNNAVPGDSPYTNCADATAVNTGNGSTSAAATACGLLNVVTNLDPSGPGTKTASQAELPLDTPVDYTINFTNDGGPLTDFAIIDPAALGSGLTDDTPPFSVAEIQSIDAVCAGQPATVTLLIPNPANPASPTRVAYDSATPADLEAARGFIVSTDTLPAGATCTINIEVQRRPGSPDGVTVDNCYLVLTDGRPAVNGDLDASTSCAPNIVTSPPRSAASLQKFIEPGDVARPTPGLDPQLATVKLRVANTGNTHLRSLTAIDSDDDGGGSDFFRSFDFVALQGVSFPPGADQVQVDVCTDGCAMGTWINGQISTSATPPLPAGVSTADIRGIRVTFTSSDPAHSGYNLVPGENFPTTGPCPQASVCFTVTPRATDRETGAPVLGTYTDTASGMGEALPTLGGDFVIPPVTADLTVTQGRPAIDVGKAVVGPASLAPGQTGLLDLTVTSTGTAALPDLQVSDPVPAELEFVETGVNGQPYTVEFTNVPDGTQPPGLVVFTPERDDSGRVTRLVWLFPGLFAPGTTVTIRIGVRLAAGVSAGTSVVNVMGAGSASTDDFDCSGSPPDGQVTGDPFLPGLNCTAEAGFTTTAGASFTAGKWSAGNPALGLYDVVRQQYTTLDDPLCPNLMRQGASFTHYPCVPLVYPGENFTFLARMTNNGTFPALDARVVDVLPAPGDTGVIDPASRGTMWDVRPRLTGPITVTPPVGEQVQIEVTYTTDDPACTSDLSPPASCPPGAWVPGYDPDATGIQAYAQFAAPGLAPGSSFDIIWQMTSPPDLAEPVSPSIAWNSFGHTELINTPGQPQQLGAVEPQKAGVGLVFGGIEVSKIISAAAGTPVPAGPFTLTYTCTVTPDSAPPVVVRTGTASFAPGQPWSLTGIPANATCVVYEQDALGGSSNATSTNPLTVVIPWNATATPATAAVTNTFPAQPDNGDLPITGRPMLPVISAGLLLLLAGLVLRTVVRRR
jgi:hypothetical protein